MNMAERLQDLRKKANYSQEQVADVIGISRQAISKWESGQGKPEMDNIIKLVELYDVSADYILLGRERYTNFENKQRKELSQTTKITIGIISIIFATAFVTILFITTLSALTNFI